MSIFGRIADLFQANLFAADLTRAEYFYAPPGDCKDQACGDKAAKSGCCGGQ